MVETKVSYPFAEGEYGISFKDLPVNTRGVTVGGSGRSLHYDIQRNYIEIEDEEFSRYRMYAKVSENSLIASVFTRRYITGERHPDFFARKFLIFAYEYFIANGHEINRISTYWIPSLDKFASINYDQYAEMLKKGFNSEDAARSTWTGRLAVEFGFTEIEGIIKDKSEGITVVFIRSDQI